MAGSSAPRCTGRSSFFVPKPLCPQYTKPFLTADQQVALLQSRGMEITDVAKAKSCLTRIGYYRLSAYWYSFRNSTPYVDPATGKTRHHIHDDFKAGTAFPTILDLYVFDKKLRLIVLDALERIEIAVRTDIAILLGQRDPKAHRNASLLHGNFSRKGAPNTKHAEWLRRLDDKFAHSKEDFAKHFKTKYAGDDMPIWIAVELWDFGALSHFFSGLTTADKDALAGLYGIPPGQILESWLRCLNDVRNICAHHSRLWNRPLVAQPRWPVAGQITEVDHLISDTHGQTRLYGALLIMRCMLKTVNPSTSWAERLKEHVATLPANPYVTLQSAGFPTGWTTLSAWR